MTPGPIGEPVSRIDGPQKVTGTATYAAEFDVPRQVHASIVRSTIAKGRIASIETSDAQRATGVLAVLTHRNAPKLPYRPHKALVDPEVGERLHVLQDDRVIHQGQPIALVVAETLEQAAHAANLVRVTYRPEAGATDVTREQPGCPRRRRRIRARPGRRKRSAAIPTRHSPARLLKSTRPTSSRASITTRSRCTPRLPPGTAII